MHIESYNIIQRAVKKYLHGKNDLSVMDFGSYDVNGTYRPIFSVPTWKYTGIDMTEGPNVDVVVDENFSWSGVESCSFDVVISGQTMEHVKEPWEMARSLGRVCKEDGLVFVVAPNTFGYHPFPIDCWRIFPEAMEHVMVKYGGFDKLECGMEGPDTFFIGRKRKQDRTSGNKMELVKTRTLQEVYKKYSGGTDKGTIHSYIDFYEKEFKKYIGERPMVLELGVWRRYSTLLWEDYFVNAEVHGVDLIDVPNSIAGHTAITYHKIDCGNKASLDEEFSEMVFDVIIDDASHVLSQQITSFQSLFPRLRAGGVYIIEDVTSEGLDQLIGLSDSVEVHDLRKYRETKYNILLVFRKKEKMFFVGNNGHDMINGNPCEFASNFDWIVTGKGLVKKSAEPKTIYVKTDYLPTFVEKIIPQVKSDFVLVSGCSDFSPAVNFKQQSEKILANPLLKRWYTENNLSSHEKIRAMPVGLNIHTHQVENMLLDMRRNPKPKQKKVFCSWRERVANVCGQEFVCRNDVRDWIKKHPDVFDWFEPGLELNGFIERMRGYKFVLCPLGNGIDPAPRAWHAMILGCIPIILDNNPNIHELYSGLPCVLVKDWNEVLEDGFLDRALKRYEKEVTSDEFLVKLSADYWEKKIKSFKRVISFSLWGNNPKYMVGAIKNAELAQNIYPGWICRYYCGKSVPADVIANLKAFPHVEIIPVPDEENWLGSYWRFRVFSDPEVEIALSRDADSRLSFREKEAVDNWLVSGKDFHVMRDHPNQKHLPAGMFGARADALRDMVKLIKSHKKDNQYGTDEDFLIKVIFPRFKDNHVRHDFSNFPSGKAVGHFVGEAFESDDTPCKKRIIPVVKNSNARISCVFSGGLGNQIFQSAHALCQSWKHNREAVFVPRWRVPHPKGAAGNSPATYQKNVFRNLKFIDDCRAFTVVDEFQCGFGKATPRPEDTTFRGNYQSDVYFFGYDDRLVDTFGPTSEFVEEMNRKYPQLSQENTVSLHVRRGDYLNASGPNRVIDSSYYDNALKEIRTYTTMFVFTDDKEWAKQNLKFDNMVFVDEDADWKELWLMSLCKHNIIANSSFSWWGAFLNRNPKKIVVCPGDYGKIRNWKRVYERTEPFQKVPVAIIPCVGYGKALEKTIAHNLQFIEKMLVITTPEDTDTQMACADHPEVTVLKTKLFTKHGAKFNKGAAIEAALWLVPKDSWVLLMDADICLGKHPFTLKNLHTDNLYGIKRRDVVNDQAYKNLLMSDFDLKYSLPVNGNKEPVALGYFQLFNTGNNNLMMTCPWYRIRYVTAASVDDAFRSLIPEKILLPDYVFHLGTRGNWEGIGDSWGFEKSAPPSKRWNLEPILPDYMYKYVWESIKKQAEEWSKETGMAIAEWRPGYWGEK